MLERIRWLSESQQKDIIGNLLLFSLFFGETAYLYFASPTTLMLCGVLGMITYLYALKYNRHLLRFMIWLSIGIVALVTINRILVLNCSWSGCLRIVFISLPIAYLLFDVHISRTAALLFFYVVFLYTVVMISLADPAELYRIFAASSRNYISVLLIACLFPYYLACQRDHTEVSVFPALMSLPVSIYVQSRGGVIASGVLAVLTFARELYRGIAKGSFKNRNNLIRFLISAVLLLGIVFFTFHKPADDGFTIDNSAENYSGEDNSSDYLARFSKPVEYPITRSAMWREYITVTGSSFKNIALGPPLTTCPLILAEAYNSHNSYFMTHSYMGIAGFLVVMAGGIGYPVLCIKKKQYNLLFLSITFLLRAMTDYLFPMLFCDCIILFMILETGIKMLKVPDECEERKNLNDCDPRI